MTCKKCGTELPESSKFCTKCGTPTSAEEMNVSASGVERAMPKGFSVKKNIIIIIIAAILLIGGGITAIAVVNSHSASSGVADRLQLAERYLNEQNYEQAIIEYQKVLEIEPMNVDAYLGLADAYIGKGELDRAAELLQEGLEKTGNKRIKNKLEKLTQKAESSSSASSAVSSADPVSSTTTPSLSTSSSPISYPNTEPTAQVTAATDFIGKNKDFYMTYFDSKYNEAYLEGGKTYVFEEINGDLYHYIEVGKDDLDSGFPLGYVFCYGIDNCFFLSSDLGETDSVYLGMNLNEVFEVLGETEIQEGLLGFFVNYNLYGYSFVLVLDSNRQKVVEFDVYLSS